MSEQHETGFLPALAMDEKELMRVLGNSIYPGAADDSIRMVIGYCKAAGLDPMQKPVHIVPMWDKKSRSMRDVIMPGIGLYRTQAARAGTYAGVSDPEFGPDVEESLGGVRMVYPMWCRVVVKRLLPNGTIAEFPAVERWKENYATADKDTAAPNAMWKRRPYGQLAKCFDPETEVLTEAGFQRFDSVTARVLQVGPAGLEPTNAVPFVQDYDGEMIVADGTRLNFCVTPNHDMLTNLGTMSAQDMYETATTSADKLSIPRAPDNLLADNPKFSDSVLRLAGYHLADGSHTGHAQFRIAVSRDYKVESLCEVGLHSRVGVKLDAGRTATLRDGRVIATKHDKMVFTYPFDLIDGLVDSDKRLISQAALSLSARQTRIVLDALLEFDGSDNGSGVRRLSQKNMNVRAAFELLAVHAGLSVSAWTDVSCTVSEAAAFPVVRNVEKNRGSLVVRKNVAGKVWCVTVPTGVIVVRRSGFSMLCRNCAEAQALRKAFPEFGAQPTAEEMEGKSIEDGATVIDGSTGEILNHSNAPKELPAYTADQMESNLPAWQDAINAGKTTPDKIMTKIRSRYRLSPEQIARISALKKEEADEGVADFLSEMEAEEQGARDDHA